MKKYKVPLKVYEIPGGGTHLLVRSKLNGVYNYMLIDTGASNSVFDTNNSAVKEINLITKEEEMQSSGFNSTIDNLQSGDIKSLKLCHFETNIPDAIFTPLDHINDLYKTIKLPKICGIIGSDFLIKYNSIINFKTKILYLEKI